MEGHCAWLANLSFFCVFFALRYLLPVSNNLSFLLSGSLTCTGFNFLSPNSYFLSFMSLKKAAEVKITLDHENHEYSRCAKWCAEL